MTMTHRRALTIVAALRTHHLIDLGFHELVQHPEPNTDAERQQPLLRGARKLTQRLTHALGQLLHALLAGHDRPSRYGAHNGWSSCPRSTWFRTHHGPKRTGRGGRTAVIKFYGLRDNLLRPRRSTGSTRRPKPSSVAHPRKPRSRAVLRAR